MVREEYCKQISLAWVGSACSVWATLGLTLLSACVLSQSTLLRLQVALQGNCLMEAIGSLHFPSLRRSASGSLVLHKGADLFESILCLSHVRAAQATMCLESVLSQVCGVSYHLPGPSCLVSWLHLQSTVSHVLCVSSGELISDCNHPGGCQLSRISGRLG